MELHCILKFRYFCIANYVNNCLSMCSFQHSFLHKLFHDDKKNISSFVVLCLGLVPINLTNTYQGYLTGIWSIRGLFQCHSGWYGKMNPRHPFRELIYRKISNKRRTKSQNLNDSRLVCSCLRQIHWSQMLSRDWRCGWSSADRRCSNYIWVINKFIALQGALYIRAFTVSTETHPKPCA